MKCFFRRLPVVLGIGSISVTGRSSNDCLGVEVITGGEETNWGDSGGRLSILFISGDVDI